MLAQARAGRARPRAAQDAVSAGCSARAAATSSSARTSCCAIRTRFTSADNVVIDDNCLLDAKGETNRGIRIGNGVFIGRNTILSCKNGDIELGDGANIGFNCEVFSASRVTIGAERADGRLQLRHRRRSRLLGSVARPVLAQTRTSAGVTIGDGVVDRRRREDSRRRRRSATTPSIGAGAVVREDVPAHAVAVGIPARVVSTRARRLSRWPSSPSSRPVRRASKAAISSSRGRSWRRRARRVTTRTSSSRPTTASAARRRPTSANWRRRRTSAAPVDQVISLRYPSYAVRHPRARVLAEPHDARVLRPLAAVRGVALARGRASRSASGGALIHAADRWLLTHHVDARSSRSRDTIQHRLRDELRRPRPTCSGRRRRSARTAATATATTSSPSRA